MANSKKRSRVQGESHADKGTRKMNIKGVVRFGRICGKRVGVRKRPKESFSGDHHCCRCRRAGSPGEA